MTLADILREYNVPYYRHGEHHHATVNSLQVDCPHCRMSGHYLLGILKNMRGANCWSCGRVSVVSSLIRITRSSYRTVISWLDNVHDDLVPHLPIGKLEIPKGVGELLPAHRTYLEKKRNFDPDEISRVWGVGGIGNAPDFQWRLFIPIHDRYGRVVSWTTRSISDRIKPKYRSARHDKESIPHKTLLYGEHYCYPHKPIILLEGPTKVWRVGPGAVASFGVSWTQEQAARMSKYAKRVICFDSEPEAQEKALELLRWLKPLPGETTRIETESSSDPADASPEEIRELRRMFTD